MDMAMYSVCEACWRLCKLDVVPCSESIVLWGSVAIGRGGTENDDEMCSMTMHVIEAARGPDAYPLLIYYGWHLFWFGKIQEKRWD